MTSISQFWEEGGWGMYPVLMIAFFVVAAGIANFQSRSRMKVTTIVIASVAAVLVGGGATTWSKQQIENVLAHTTLTSEQKAQVREQGAREGHRPTEFGEIVAGMGLLFLAAGALGGQKATSVQSGVAKSWTE